MYWLNNLIQSTPYHAVYPLPCSLTMISAVAALFNGILESVVSAGPSPEEAGGLSLTEVAGGLSPTVVAGGLSLTEVAGGLSLTEVAGGLSLTVVARGVAAATGTGCDAIITQYSLYVCTME